MQEFNSQNEIEKYFDDINRNYLYKQLKKTIKE